MMPLLLPRHMPPFDAMLLLITIATLSFHALRYAADARAARFVLLCRAFRLHHVAFAMLAAMLFERTGAAHAQRAIVDAMLDLRCRHAMLPVDVAIFRSCCCHCADIFA